MENAPSSETRLGVWPWLLAPLGTVITVCIMSQVAAASPDFVTNFGDGLGLIVATGMLMAVGLAASCILGGWAAMLLSRRTSISAPAMAAVEAAIGVATPPFIMLLLKLFAR